jgi:hypothetical protein
LFLKPVSVAEASLRCREPFANLGDGNGALHAFSARRNESLEIHSRCIRREQAGLIG